MTTSIRSASIRALTLWLACASSVAVAGRSVVLKADGNASADMKANIQVSVLQLARNVDALAEPGDVTFADAAAAVGCSGDETTCRDDVVGTLAVDEVVSTTVTALPNGDIAVVVRRVPKTGAIRDAHTTILAGQPVESNVATTVGPLFGVRAKPPLGSSRGATPSVGSVPDKTGATPGAIGALPREGQPVRSAGATWNGSAETSERRRSAKPIVGLAVGGAFATLGVILWSQAAATQSDIDVAPTNTPGDFRYLKDLESRGSAYANVGNVFFIAGAVVAGVSGYFLWQDRRAPSGHARITPTVFGQGAGIALTVGGIP